jgi:hypothetical protein
MNYSLRQNRSEEDYAGSAVQEITLLLLDTKTLIAVLRTTHHWMK